MEAAAGQARLLLAATEAAAGHARLLLAAVEAAAGHARLLLAAVEAATGQARLLLAAMEAAAGQARLLLAAVEAATRQLVTGVHSFVLHLRFLMDVVGVDADHFCVCHRAKTSVLCDHWAGHPGLGARPAEVYLSA